MIDKIHLESIRIRCHDAAELLKLATPRPWVVREQDGEALTDVPALWFEGGREEIAQARGGNMRTHRALVLASMAPILACDVADLLTEVDRLTAAIKAHRHEISLVGATTPDGSRADAALWGMVR